MKLFLRSLIISCISITFGLTLCLADDSDCGVFAIQQYINTWSEKNWFDAVKKFRWTDQNIFSNFLSVDQQIDIIDTASLDTAILNLKNYCCTNSLWWLKPEFAICVDDHKFFNPNSLDSPYLFDHLYDVIMRRLTWLTWDTDIYNNMTVDDKWAQRRWWISSVSESILWEAPQTIIDQYSWNRSKTHQYDILENVIWKFWSDSTDFLRFVSWNWNSQESKQISNAIKNYHNRTLYDRYNNSCALAAYFYILLWQNQSLWDKGRTVGSMTNCKTITQNQIQNENNYTKMVIQKTANQFNKNYLEWYLSYMNDRFIKLNSSWKNSTDRFLDVVRAVPQLIKQCTK